MRRRKVRGHLALLECPECGEGFEVDYVPYDNGRHGHIDNWYPPEGPEFNTPPECPECGLEFSEKDIEKMETEAEERICSEAEDYEDRDDDR